MSLEKSNSELKIGEKAPDFTLQNFDGQKVSLSDLDNYDGVLVIFMCNHCPYVKSQVEELKKLNTEYSSIALVGINPNSKTHPEDSVEKMGEFVSENELDSAHFYYLVDEDQDVSKSYGAKCTPDPFLLDWRHRLYYKGRLNDKTSPEEDVNNREISKAINDMLKRKKPSEESEPSVGCSIKWQEE